MTQNKNFSDEMLQKVTGQIVVGQAVLVAHDLGLFVFLSKGEASVNDVATGLGIKCRGAQALISCCCSMGFIDCHNQKYRLSPLGKVYLDPKSSKYYGKIFDLLIEQSDIMNYDKIKKSVLKNTSQVDEEKDLFTDSGVGSSEKFIQGLHAKAYAPAFFWANKHKLEGYKTFVDIGCGSGIHAIAACCCNPELQAVFCDRNPVLVHTKKNIANFGLSNRATFYELDFWNSKFPEGDVIFLGDILHDWETEKCIHIVKQCYKALRKGGKILLHEMLFCDAKEGPFLTSAYNMKMMLWTEGRQYTFQEISSILTSAGFENCERQQSLGNWSLVVAQKN